MTSFFPDLNVWLALSDAAHMHTNDAWNWFRTLPTDRKLIFSRHTQIGLLRLLTSSSVMNMQPLTLGKAWSIYDRWLEHPSVEFYPEPRNLDSAFRQSTAAFSTKPASKAIGDCLLLATAKELHATLVTFDRGLQSLAHKQHCAAILPG